MRNTAFILFFFLLLALCLLLSCSHDAKKKYTYFSGSDSTDNIITAPELSSFLKSRPDPSPVILCVSPRPLYNSGHLPGALFAGPVQAAEGENNFYNVIPYLNKDDQIILYCGCGHMDICPNISNAYEQLTSSGFLHVKKLYLPYGFRADWEDKGYPVAY